MRNRGTRERKALGQMTAVLGVLVFSSFFLILHVWLPVQGERSLKSLESIEKRISLQKASLQKLQSVYGRKTSLSTLDEWATKNGPWRAPQDADIVRIYE